MKTYEEAVAYILDIPKFTRKNTTEDTKAFLAKLGDPDEKLNIIHVAGTNGKGSVCAYMRSVLKEAGNRVAVFTSPHLVDIRERFMINGRMISKRDFMKAFQMVYKAIDHEAVEAGKGYHPTFFEYLFFMACLIFAEKKPDYCIMETGLGGRLDATNSVKHKLISVITRISLDHVEYLGDTPQAIAGEKAGIIAQETPVVYLSTEKSVDAVFVKKAQSLKSPAVSVSNADYKFCKFKNYFIDFSYVSSYYGIVPMRLKTIARYQMENCALALRALETLGVEMTAEQMRKGVLKCFWPGRMEEVLPDVFVDGAHNEDGIRAFLETVGEDNYNGRRTLLFSVVSDKDYTAMITEIKNSGLFGQIAFAPLQSKRAATLQQVGELMKEENPLIYPSVSKALEELLSSKKDGERLYIAGSLYLVGEVKEALTDRKWSS